MRGNRGVLGLTGLLILPPLAVYALGWFVCEALVGLVRADSLGISAVPAGVVAAAVPILLATRGERHRAPSKVLCGLIPARPAGYQARTDVQRRIATGRGITVVHALTGARGVGKSVEAAECARTALAKGTRVAWINAESREQIVAAFAEAAGHLGLDTDGQETEDTAARAVRALADAGERVLVVFDNVLDPAPVREFLPTGPRVRVVVTTTEQAAVALGTAIDIGRFSRAEARRFLAERTGLDVDGHAEELIDELDALPLALAHATARIEETGQDFAGYLTDLRAFPVERALPRATWDHYPRSVAAAVMLSVERVVAEDPDKAWDVLARLSLLSPAGASIGLLYDGTEADRFASVEVCARLKNASLVTLAAGESVLIMHRLTQRVVREAVDPDVLTAAVRASLDRITVRLSQVSEHSMSTGRDVYLLYLEQASAMLAVAPPGTDEVSVDVLTRLDRLRHGHLDRQRRVAEVAASLEDTERELVELERSGNPRVAALRERAEKLRRSLDEMH